MGNGSRFGLAAVLTLTTAASPAQEPAGQLPRRLTLRDAVEQALRRNHRLIDASEGVEQADLSVALARNRFHPKITPNILGSFGQSDVSNQTYRLALTQEMTFGTQIRASVGTMTSRNQLGNFYNSDMTLELSQPLLRGFGRRAARYNLDSAELGLDEARRHQTLAEQQVVVQVAQAYYTLIAQQRLVGVGRTSLERSRHLLEASRAKLAAGMVSQLDVFRAQQLVAQAEGQLLDARAAVEDARDNLRLLLDLDGDADLEVDTEIPRTVERLSTEEAVATALERRLERQGAVAAAVAADKAVAFSRNQLLPQVDFRVAVTRRETAETFGSSFRLDNFDVVAFAAVSVPVDRTPQTIAYHRSLIERDRRRRRIRTLRKQIAGEARRAVRRQNRLLTRLEVEDASLAFAEKEVEVAQLRFQRGLSNNLDVVNAQAGLLDAESRRIATLAELAVARLSLRATLGILDPRVDVGEPGSAGENLDDLGAVGAPGDLQGGLAVPVAGLGISSGRNQERDQGGMALQGRPVQPGGAVVSVGCRQQCGADLQ